MRNGNRNADMLLLGAVGVLGFFAFKALTSSRSASGTARSTQPRPRRNFVVLYSMHGAPFAFGTEGNELPSGPHLTFAEAAAKARQFDVSADAVDGKACVLDVATGERYTPYPQAVAE